MLSYRNHQLLSSRLTLQQETQVRIEPRGKFCHCSVYTECMSISKQELDLQHKVLIVKLIQEALDMREFEDFEMTLEHKSSLHIHTELKQEVEFEE